jgi:hypothetical protein
LYHRRPFRRVCSAENAFWAWLPFLTTQNLAERVENAKTLAISGKIRGQVGLRSLSVSKNAINKGEAAQDLRKICGYLEKHAHRMRHREYLRLGYPIASGVIGGACRHLVKDRMEGSGMRWTLAGARSMLHVHAAF